MRSRLVVCAPVLIALLLAGCMTPGTDLNACARQAAQAALEADGVKVYQDAEWVVNPTENKRVSVEVSSFHCGPWVETDTGSEQKCTGAKYHLTVVDLGLGCRVLPERGLEPLFFLRVIR